MKVHIIGGNVTLHPADAPKLIDNSKFVTAFIIETNMRRRFKA